ncbi:MAG: serine hydroxymethyltransferase, partial [Candidatus Bathyarchaeia archaeon]
MNAQEYYEKVFTLLEEHHKWFSASIPLIASENVPSTAVREAIISDFGNRYAEGWPGERVYAGCIYIDQVESLCIELAKELFKAEFVDVRPTSGVCANLVAYTAFTKPGDLIMALSIPNGGHISYGKMELGGTAGAVRGLRLAYFPFDNEEMNIDVDKTVDRIEKLKREGDRVSMAMFGASVFLFPHPVRELADYLKSQDITICYDAAHVLGLIIGGTWRNPLDHGADVMTASTHKTFPGPQGGMIAFRDEGVYKAVGKTVFPWFVSNHHLHRIPATLITALEMAEYGEAYAKQIVSNARTLAEELASYGFNVLGEKLGYTRSHQVVVNVRNLGGGAWAAQRLEEANIIVNKNLLP